MGFDLRPSSAGILKFALVLCSLFGAAAVPGCIRHDCVVTDVLCGPGALFLGNQRGTSGSFDTSFGTNGRVTYRALQTGASVFDTGQGVLVDANGRIFVSGSTVGATSDTFVCRLLDNGSLDTAFAAASSRPGCAFFDNAAGAEQTNGGLAIDASGRIYLPSYAGVNMLLARYTANGVLDTSFNTTGVVISSVGGNGESQGVVIDASGRVIVSGRTTCPGPGCDWTIWRYTSAGGIDTSFGAGSGYVIASGGYATSFDIELDLQGRLYATGMRDSGQGNVSMEVRRYNGDGTVDTSFGSSGFYNFPLGGMTTTGGSELAIDPGGSIYVAGGFQTSSPNDSDMALWKLTSSGVLDTSFAGVGYVRDNNAGGAVTASTQWRDEALIVRIDRFGRLYLLGVSCNNVGFDVCPGGQLTGYSLILFRFTPDGQPDTTFNEGSHKKVIDHNVSFQNTYARKYGMTLDPLGRILIVAAVDPDAISAGDGAVMRAYRIWP